MKLSPIPIILALLIASCTSFKHELSKSGGENEAIANAILDFSKLGLIYSRDSVFLVSFVDTVRIMKLDKETFPQSWVLGLSKESMLAVRIGASYEPFLLNEHIKVGSKGKFPSRILRTNGKLFYWWDDSFPLTQEVIDVFKKYNLVRDSEIALASSLVGTDERQKAAHYYFCRNNLTRYKRVITNLGLGYYSPPRLKCE